MLKKLIGPLALVAAVVVVYTLVKSREKPQQQPQNTPQKLNVLTITAEPSVESILIKTQGTVQPRWQTELSSEVSGRVLEISEKLLVGASFKANDVFLRIEDTDYQAALARQKANLTQAKELVMEEQLKGQRARRDWEKINPNRAAPDFTLRIPQLETAQRNLEGAQAELRLAQKNLERTVIRAPYDGYVLSRSVDVGEFIQPGTAIASIFSSQDMEIQIPLTNQQIALINKPQQTPIILYGNDNGKQQWQATISRLEQVVDANNRWRDLIAEIDDSSEMPLNGAFLQVEINTASDQALLILPENSLSMSGHLWYVNASGLLNKMSPDILFRNNGNIYLKPPQNLTYPLQVLMSPAASLLEGIAVNATPWTFEKGS
ncbi:efflux RND transporter periplasmic adaptor subunit [Marinicella sp. W31]|uniref:efflux RND transporter periplasmic adaptor subunit n=1 Tax=Marinicella sp. W31 TaxID=3023713 RepID=UPI00375642BA